MAGSLDEQQPLRRTLLATLRRNFHWKCFFLTIMIDSCIAVTSWCQFAQPTDSTASSNKFSQAKGPCDHGYSFIPIAFAIMLYIVYLMECWHCKTRMELSVKVDINSAYETIAKLRGSMPVVWWRAVCYHYIRRTRYRNGDAVTTTQVYYERMNSHTAGSVFLYQDCGVKDISKKLVGLEKYPVTKIRFTKGFVFANIQSANEFEDQRARFFQENEQRDDYMEVREGLDLLNQPFKEYIIAFANQNKLPFYASQAAFWTFSFLLLSWFLRVLVEYKTAYVHYQVTKLFGTNYLSPTSQNYTGPMTTLDTSEARDADSGSHTNYYIVPSYSEALLMDPVNVHTHLVQDNQGNVRVTSRQRFHRGGSQGTLCNENVVPNYGALIREGMPLVVERTPRSRSMTFLRPWQSNQVRDARHLPENNIRSFSFGNLVYLNRGAYQAVPMTPEDGGIVSLEEPPPPYELALQMCRPLYAKIKRSLSSLDKFRFRSSSDKSGLGSSRDNDTPL